MKYYFPHEDNPVGQPGYDYIKNFIHKLLNKAYKNATLSETPEQADVIVVDAPPKIHDLKPLKKPLLGFSMETEMWDFHTEYHKLIQKHCHASLSMNRKLIAKNPQRHLYVPYWLARYHSFKHCHIKHSHKQHFCCSLVRQNNRITQLLHKNIACYQQVDDRDTFVKMQDQLDLSPLKNWIDNKNFYLYTAQKFAWLLRYRFHIARENRPAPGYVTEKLLEGRLADTVCIYHGHKDVLQDFNPQGFIYVRGASDLLSLPWKIKRLDQDPAKQEAMRQQPLFNPGVIDDKYNLDRLAEQLKRALD